MSAETPGNLMTPGVDGQFWETASLWQSLTGLKGPGLRWGELVGAVLAPVLQRCWWWGGERCIRRPPKPRALRERLETFKVMRAMAEQELVVQWPGAALTGLAGGLGLAVKRGNGAEDTPKVCPGITCARGGVLFGHITWPSHPPVSQHSPAVSILHPKF